MGRYNQLLSNCTDRTENDRFNNSSTVANVLIATVNIFPSSCLTTVRVTGTDEKTNERDS
jgi:hypothetical protein